MTRIVVLGGSFGGLTASFELKRLLGGRAEITVVSDLDEFVFIPSLPWLSLGWRSAKDITIPLKEILEPKGIIFRHEEVKGVDADSSKVILGSGGLPYDYLVIATGPALAFGEVPGLGPDGGHTECIFTLPLAERAKKAWDRFLENPGPMAVGSVQGASCFGPPYEYAFEIDAELRRRKIRHKVPMHFITSEPYIGHFGIGGFGASKRWLEDEFAERDIKILANRAVEEFTPGEVKLKDGTKIPFKLAMFAPAMKGVPAVAHLGNPRGFIPVDERMRHKTHKNVFVVGVAVAIAPPEPTPIPTGVPKTGFMTVRMALAAARTIASEIRGTAMPGPYEMNVLCLMDMGTTAAYMSAKPLLPPRQETTLKKALWARWMKMAFERYFLFKMKHGLSNWP
ncbi:MAG: FAD-dependent oxidoreductase [Thermodesulfovibrionales bacterium]|nr:FAD-dependent oxidoreductase [Thermodesulfovibrionales bacterium]